MYLYLSTLKQTIPSASETSLRHEGLVDYRSILVYDDMSTNNISLSGVLR